MKMNNTAKKVLEMIIQGESVMKIAFELKITRIAVHKYISDMINAGLIKRCNRYELTAEGEKRLSNEENA